MGKQDRGAKLSRKGGSQWRGGEEVLIGRKTGRVETELGGWECPSQCS